jgi:hypothetical protein
MCDIIVVTEYRSVKSLSSLVRLDLRIARKMEKERIAKFR